MTSILSDEEIRFLVIDLLKAPTERDRQTLIGASNLANGCDFCLASEMTGVTRSTPQTDQAWLGRVMGTALHATLESRMRAAISGYSHAARIAAQYGDSMKIEERAVLGEIPGYGVVRTTGDLILGPLGLDYKGSTRKKTCLLKDFIALQRGETAPFGRTHKYIKLSEAQYAEEMVKMAYKMDGYYAQTQLYARVYGCSRFSIVFVNRDGTGWFDNPAGADYEHPSRVHDVFVLSFDYNPEFAQAVWDRGVRIWQRLEGGEPLSEFASHEHCFPCGQDRKTKERYPEAGQVLVPV